MAPTKKWQAVSLAHALMGYEANVLGIVTQYFGGASYTQALLVIAFLLYSVSVILLVLTQFNSLAFDLVVAAIVIAFMIVSAIFTVTGVVLSLKSSRENPYAASLLVSSALLAVAVAILVTASINADSNIQRTGSFGSNARRSASSASNSRRSTSVASNTRRTTSSISNVKRTESF